MHTAAYKVDVASDRRRRENVQGTFFFTHVSRSYASRSLEDMNNVFLSFSKKAAWFLKGWMPDESC